MNTKQAVAALTVAAAILLGTPPAHAADGVNECPTHPSDLYDDCHGWIGQAVGYGRFSTWLEYALNPADGGYRLATIRMSFEDLTTTSTYYCIRAQYRLFDVDDDAVSGWKTVGNDCHEDPGAGRRVTISDAAIDDTSLDDVKVRFVTYVASTGQIASFGRRTLACDVLNDDSAKCY